MDRRPRILAMGGHDFTRRPEDRALNDYIVHLTGNPSPRICLVPTASGDPQDQIARFNAAFLDRGAQPTVVSLFRPGGRRMSLRRLLADQDAIYVGGGSMVNLLAVWRAHGMDRILLDAWRNGVLICGQSAGAMCWFQAGVTKSSGEPAIAEGLGALPWSCCVHYHGEPERRALFTSAVAEGLRPGFGIDDGAAILWEEDKLVEVVSARPGATAHRVEAFEGGVDETSFPARSLATVRPTEAPELLEFRRQARIARYARHAMRRMG